MIHTKVTNRETKREELTNYKKIVFVLAIALILVSLVEFLSFLLIIVGKSALEVIRPKNDNISQLYRLGLPNQYVPLGLQGSRPGPWPILMSSSPAYKEYEWAEDFWKLEHKRHQSYLYQPSNIFQPNVIWRERPRNEIFVNINEEGIRNTINPDINFQKDTRTIFLFGGSTMAGTGVPDEFTIPSLLSKYLNKKGDISYNVTNFGTGSFILEQDMQLFFDEIRKGHLPDTAVFYHGANDAYAGVYSPGKPTWYLGSEGLQDKFYYMKSSIWYKELHTYRLLELIKKRLFRLLNLSTADTTPTNAKNSEFYLDDYQQKAGHFLEHYQETLRLINNVCNSYGIDTIFIWQPILMYGNKRLNEFEESMVNNPALLSIGTFRTKDGIYQKKALETTYHLVEKASFLEFPNFYNFSHVFDRSGDEPLYIDWVHLGPKGNSIVAQQINKIICALND